MPFFEIETKDKSSELTCTDCGLHLKCKSPKMAVAGRGRKKILIMSSCPSEEQDRTGDLFAGKGTAYLQEELEDIGIDLERDCWKTNALLCRSEQKDIEKKGLSNNQLKACAKNWQNTLSELKPEKLILLGRNAVESFLTGRMNKIGGINKWAGNCIPDQDYKLWVFPTYHPEFIRQSDNPVLENRFYSHLETAIKHSDPFVIDKPEIEIITELDDAIYLLEDYHNEPPKLLSFDYEGSGLKPHRKGHFIRTVAFSEVENKAIAMPMFDDWKFRDLFQFLMENPKVRKTAHNKKFENAWTRAILGYDVKGLDYCSMIASHILDNRGGISSLKHQTYINFGVAGYEDEMKPYMEGCKPGEDEKSANRFNRIDEAPLEKLLYYNGLDANYGLKLTLLQVKKLTPKLREACTLFFDGIATLGDMEQAGWLVDSKYYDKAQTHLDRLDSRNSKLILSSDENKLYKSVTGEDINKNSTDQLRSLFFDKDMMGFTPTKFTKNKNKKTASVDKEVLEDLACKSAIAQAITTTRKNKGLRDKVKAFQREAVNGVIHPSYNLHIPRSYRSSCNDPNMQNADKRDEWAKKLIRAGVIARPGRMLVARDYSGVEVATGCFYHKDPVMIEYVSDESKDMHRDTAMRLFDLNKKQMTKPIRHIAKNMFVFPQFYGDWYKTCAESMWKALQSTMLVSSAPMLQHMHDNGVRNYKDFEKRVQEEERYFWQKRFSVYTEWKEINWENYQSKGYIETLLGFRFTDIMSKNEANNRPIQGTAFHLLLWSLIETHAEIKEWQSYLIGQIHDDMLADVHPDEFDNYIKLTDEIETIRIRNQFPWINVPLGVETEVSEIDGNWYKMKEYKY